MSSITVEIPLKLEKDTAFIHKILNAMFHDKKFYETIIKEYDKIDKDQNPVILKQVDPSDLTEKQLKALKKAKEAPLDSFYNL